jgi:uncharacterized protein (DUF1810 family)
MTLVVPKMSDPFNLQRFVDAQAPLYDRVCAELRAGEKTSHWMWFIFPQLQGLGRSSIAVKFAIASRQQAAAYAAHPVLGLRLQECTKLVNSVEGRSASEIFGDPDELKFHSSMTLFAAATSDNAVFHRALKKYFDGKLDPLTIDLLRP